MNKKSGFTLIEVIVTLFLVGIMATVAGMGIASAVKGYVFAKNNVVIAGKAQVALARMTRELIDLRDIPDPATNANAAFIKFYKAIGSVAFGQSGSTIMLAKDDTGFSTLDYTAGDILTNQIATSGLNFAYQKGSATWVPGTDEIQRLSQIVITLTMTNAGSGSNYTFNTTVTPRNNGNFGGQPAPTVSSPPPGFGCFVATAAYGDQYHPMVILLKQFRDECLIKLPGGGYLIQLYYKGGPYLAAMIQDRPWACALSRLLLLPFVGLAFVLVYAKGSIPLFILLIILSILLVKRYSGRSKIMRSMLIYKEKGSVLVGLIVTMVIMAFLGAALVSMTSSSALSNVYNFLPQKAYYMAESGFRYAASEFFNVNDSENNGKNENQNSKTNDLNGRTLTVSTGNTIQLTLTPFYFVYYNSTTPTTAAAVGATSLQVKFPGADPGNFYIPSSGMIQIITQTRASSSTPYTTYTDYYSYSAFNTGTKTFTLTSGLLRAVPPWTTVTVLAQPSSDQTVTPSTDISGTTTTNRLTLTRPTTGFFMPQYNGLFMMKEDTTKVVYKYAYRDHVSDASTTTTLYGVSNLNNPSSHASFTVTSASSYIVPKDFMTIVSKGTTSGVSRTLTYLTPIDLIALSPGGAGAETISSDPFTAGINPGAATSNWYTPSHGTFGTTSITGGEKAGAADHTALQMSSSTVFSWLSSQKFGFTALKWSTNYANFWGAWYNHDQTLSYDAQVKVAIAGHTNDYYQAGLAFRLNLGTAGDLNDTSSLGVSFVRGHGDFIIFETDGIYDGVTPVDSTPMIVIWKKDSGSGLEGMKWVAYKVINSTITFNGGQNPKFANNNTPYDMIRGGTSGARAYNITAVNTADSGVTGQLVVSSVYSTFQAGEQLFQLIKQNNTTARVRTPVSSTSIGFDNGRTGINVGDIILGQSSNAKARVTAVNKTGGNWPRSCFLLFCSGGDAYGTISIDQLEGTFTTSDNLDVYRPNASYSALYVSYDPLADILMTSNTRYIKEWTTLVLRIKEHTAPDAPFSGSNVNDIQIYVGDTAAHTTPTGSPLDGLRYDNLRWSNPPATDDVQWPPDAGWSSNLAGNLTRDHFTLVRGWVFNTSASDVNNYYKIAGTAEEPNSIIRTTKYTTHAMTAFSQQELGLQTSGYYTDGNILFDDFAVRLIGSEISESSGFASPLQY